MFLNQRASLLVGTILVAGLTAAPTRVHADQINVSATITAECNIEGDADLAFGNYDPTGGTEASTTLTVSCTAPADVGVTLNGGQNPNGTRRMEHSTAADEFLAYLLFDGVAAGGQGDVWTSGLEIVFEDVPPAGTDITIGGQITGGQTGPSGTYNDVVLVTLDVK
jgi:spore coat protein U-like protein